METTLNPAKFMSALPAMETQLDNALDRVKTLGRTSSARTRASDTTEQLKIIGKIVDTISTFVTEMVKTFEKMRANDSAKSLGTKTEDNVAVKEPDKGAVVSTSPTLHPGDSPTLAELTKTIDDLFTKLNSITKKIENLSKKVSSLGKKLLKGASGGATSLLSQGAKLLS